VRARCKDIPRTIEGSLLFFPTLFADSGDGQLHRPVADLVHRSTSSEHPSVEVGGAVIDPTAVVQLAKAEIRVPEAGPVQEIKIEEPVVNSTFPFVNPTNMVGSGSQPEVNPSDNKTLSPVNLPPVASFTINQVGTGETIYIQVIFTLPVSIYIFFGLFLALSFLVFWGSICVLNTAVKEHLTTQYELDTLIKVLITKGWLTVVRVLLAEEIAVERIQNFWGLVRMTKINENPKTIYKRGIIIVELIRKTFCPYRAPAKPIREPTDLELQFVSFREKVGTGDLTFQTFRRNMDCPKSGAEKPISANLLAPIMEVEAEIHAPGEGARKGSPSEQMPE